MNDPLVSIIVPVYNGERYVRATLDSLFRQNYPNLELIVVNDGSTDHTQKILQEFGDTIHILSQENKGPAAARNAGIRFAHGEIIGLLDADDLWPEDHLSLMLPLLLQEPLDFVRGTVRYMRMKETGETEYTQDIFLDALVGACLYKKSVFETVGLFDEDLRQGEDFDWSMRLTESGCKEKRISHTALLYRRHEHNLTNSEDVMKKGQLAAFRKRVARLQALRTSST